MKQYSAKQIKKKNTWNRIREQIREQIGAR